MIGTVESWIDTAVGIIGLGITLGVMIQRNFVALRREIRSVRREVRKVERHAQWAAGLAIEALAQRPNGRRWYDTGRPPPPGNGRSDGTGYHRASD